MKCVVDLLDLLDPVGSATVMPSDQEEDAYGQMKYSQDANGAWYNNSAFYEMPVAPNDFGAVDVWETRNTLRT